MLLNRNKAQHCCAGGEVLHPLPGRNVFPANRTGADGSVADVSVNRKQRRIGRHRGNKQVGSGFNHFQDRLCVCVCVSASVN